MENKATWPKLMWCNVQGSINNLWDELLLEILLRLPDCKSVARCKCVCKLWATVASHPRFFDLFIHCKLEDVHGTDNECFGIVMQYEWNLPAKCKFNKLYKEFKGLFRSSIFNAQDSSFSPLHSFGEDNAMLIASCQDLLLYWRHKNDKTYFYISNVQTSHSVMLPSPPNYYNIQYLHVGFICDPIYSCGREVIVNAAYHYSVVFLSSPNCIPRSTTKFSVQLYSSHCDSRWCHRVLSTPTPCTLCLPKSHRGFSFCFDGKLHFSGLEGFFGFDHATVEFHIEIQCHFIKWPVGLIQGNHRVGVSRGTLHVSAYVDDLFVWVLEDYKTGNWMLQYRIKLSDWVPRNPWMTEKLKKFTCYQGQIHYQGLVNILGVHPSNSDVIYLLIPGCIFCCNLSTKTLDLVCRIPVAVAKTCRHYLTRFYGFVIIFQSWPTPLLPFVQGLKVGMNTLSSSCTRRHLALG